MAWQTNWEVFIDGNDMSARMETYLQSLEVEDREGASSDRAELVFEDLNGRCMLPQGGERVLIKLEGQEIFEGILDSPEWELSRGGGRNLRVSCTSHHARGKAKEGQAWHQDGGTLESFLKNAAQHAGLRDIKVDPAFAAITRDYWSPHGMSFLHLGRSLALELGGIFKIKGDQAVLVKRGVGRSVGGVELPMVPVIVGQNVKSLKITPFHGRSRSSKALITRFDRKKAAWEKEEVEIEKSGGSTDGVMRLRFPRSGEAEAKWAGEGQKSESLQERGSGSAVIDLNIVARAGGRAEIRGAREGIDGVYAISSVRHQLSRQGGGETSLEVRGISGQKK